MVKVPPETSSGASFLERARSARSTMARPTPRKFFSSALLDDRDDEAPVQRDGDADVDVLVVEDGVALDRGVDHGVLAQGGDGGAGDERHVGELDAVALLVLVLFFLAQADDAGHIDLEDGVDVRAGVLGLDHALGDDAAHFGHGDELAELLGATGGLGGGGGGGGRLNCRERGLDGGGAAAAGGPAASWLAVWLGLCCGACAAAVMPGVVGWAAAAEWLARWASRGSRCGRGCPAW